MEWEDPDAEERMKEDRRAAKVVHLPVDWLGPRDQLVPFGPGRDASLDGESPRQASIWGDDSAALHDALQAPDFAYRRDAGSEDGPATRPHEADQPPAARVASGLLAGGLSWRSRGVRRVRLRAPQPSALVAVIGVIVVIAAGVAAGVAGLGSSPGQRYAPRQVAGQPQLHSARTLVTAVAIPPVLGPVRLRLGSRRAAVRHQPTTRRVHVRRVARTTAASHSGGSGGNSSYPATTSQPPAGGVSTTPSYASSHSTAASNPTANVGATSSSPPAGPVGAGAPFAPGHLG